jgi:hypothetical protein
MHIVELQRKLVENREDFQESKIRIRTAKADEAGHLLKTGLFSPEEISYFRSIPMPVILAEKARIEEHELRKQRYRETLNMDLPGQMAHVTIFEK